MKYIILCGGWTCRCEHPKHLFEVNGKTLLERTIGLLQDCGVTDIAITTSPDCIEKYNKFGVEVIPYEANNVPYIWLDAFYLTYEPVCYLFGDVLYSPEAMKTIVETQTKDIEFFASAPPFAENYPKDYAEPFAFKVVNYRRFRCCVMTAKEGIKKGVWYRSPISWELWQVIKNTLPNKIMYNNYVVINDYTCDVDYEGELGQWNII